MSEPENKPETKPADELGDAGKKALDEERKARKAAEAELADLRKFKAEREAADLRAEIVSEKGLTPEMAEALAGDTREALEAHADKLKALIPKPTTMGRPKENLVAGASNVDDEGTYDPAKIADRIDAR